MSRVIRGESKQNKNTGKISVNYDIRIKSLKTKGKDSSQFTVSYTCRSIRKKYEPAVMMEMTSTS